jgi:hypothetical protein
MHPVIEILHRRLRADQRIRILAFGSSNTEHYLPGMHWFDCFDIALQNRYGRLHTCINTGIGGNTSRDLLTRFKEDAEFYQPHFAFVTIGGNESTNAAKYIPAEKFESNLLELHRLFYEIDCNVIFQTYYAPDPDGMGDLKRFYQYAEIVRSVAKKTGAMLIDHLARWEPFRKRHTAIYKKLMHNPFHVNRHGNKVMGVDIAREFHVPLSDGQDPFWSESLKIQKLMDEA